MQCSPKNKNTKSLGNEMQQDKENIVAYCNGS